MGRKRDRVELEHQVGDDRSDTRAEHLRGYVRDELFRRKPPEHSIGEAHDGIEMRAGHGSEREDQRDEAGAGRDGVLQQLQPDVVR